MASAKAVLVDVDGTLVDTVDLHARAWVDTFGHFGVEADLDEVRRQIGKGGDQLLPGLIPPAMLEAKAEEMSAFRADLFKREYLPQVRAFPGVRALFERIHAAGQKIVLASSGETDEVEAHKRIADTPTSWTTRRPLRTRSGPSLSPTSSRRPSPSSGLRSGPTRR